MSELFYWVLNMSINALICAIPVLIIRAIKKIPRRYIVFLWAIPFLRMVLPISVSSDFSLMKVVSLFASKTIRVYEGQFSSSMMNHLTKAESYFPITYKTEKAETFFYVCGNIWIVVFLALLFSFFIIYFSTMKEIRKSILLKDNVFVSDEIKTPAVYGIFRPKIVIPNNYSEKNLKYILLHENMHIKSFDNFFRVVAVFLVCFHWFNPFCLLFLKLFYIDMELSCDERVLLRLKEDERKEYARTLLSSLEKTVVFVSLFGGAKIKTRINNIISYKKITLLSSVFFIFFIALTFYFLLTNA